jgi:hypothetical protein
MGGLGRVPGLVFAVLLGAVTIVGLYVICSSTHDAPQLSNKQNCALPVSQRVGGWVC